LQITIHLFDSLLFHNGKGGGFKATSSLFGFPNTILETCYYVSGAWSMMVHWEWAKSDNRIIKSEDSFCWRDL